MGIALLIIGGLLGLVFGGDLLVRGAVDLARRIGLSPLVRRAPCGTSTVSPVTVS